MLTQKVPEGWIKHTTSPHQPEELNQQDGPPPSEDLSSSPNLALSLYLAAAGCLFLGWFINIYEPVFL